MHLWETDQARNWLKGFEERFNLGVLLRPGLILRLTRASKIFCAASAFPVRSVSKDFWSTSATASTGRRLKVMKPSKAMALIFGTVAVRAGGLDTKESLAALAAARATNLRDLAAG
jgi:hypothetical protein